MSLVLQILRFLSGCLFSQSGQIPRFPILPTLGISVLGLFFSSSIALFGNQANHTLFLTESDVVMGTGNNQYGQLSVPVVTQSSVPVQSKFGVRKVASGWYHTLFLMWDGTVWAVGKNSDGQLGDGTTINRSNPVQVVDGSGNPLGGVTAISAGDDFSIFLMDDGTCQTVGKNTTGQLSDGTTFNRMNSVQVLDGQGNVLEKVVGISAGANHSLFLKSDGTVWSSGENSEGRLGDGTTTNRTGAVQVMKTSVESLNGVSSISGGYFHSVFLKNDGSIFTVGLNADGQLGDSTYSNRIFPVQVQDSLGNIISTGRQIDAGGWHTVILDKDGTVWNVGRNQFGQLGDGTITKRNNPIKVSLSNGNLFDQVISISAKANQTILIKDNGTIWGIGKNTDGRLGNGSTSNKSRPESFVDAQGLPVTDVISCSSGNMQTIYLKVNGSLWSTGSNAHGQLGDGTTTDRTNPVRVLQPLGGAVSNIVKFASGHSHNILLKGDSSVWGVGYNDRGQIGDLSNTNRTNPVEVLDSSGEPLSSVKDISAGWAHSLFLMKDGTVQATGRNDHGQLGDGTNFDRTSSVPVLDSGGSPFSDVTAISAGAFHSLFLKSDGSVWATGENSDGRLGDGTTISRSNPVQVMDGTGVPLSDIIAISGGEMHSVLLKSDGTVWAMGYNGYGRLGMVPQLPDPIQYKSSTREARYLPAYIRSPPVFPILCI